MPNSPRDTLTESVLIQQMKELMKATNSPSIINTDFIDEMSTQKPMTATHVRDMQKKSRHAENYGIGMPSMNALMQDHITDAQRLLASKLFSEHVKPGKLTVNNTTVERNGPSVRARVVEDEPVYVPAPNDAFPVQVAVTAKLDEVGMCVPRIVNQITEAVQVRRKNENMQARDLLETFVSYADTGLNVKITANATLSKAVVEAVFSEDVKDGVMVFRTEEMTYDQFEAYQDAVSGAKGR